MFKKKKKVLIGIQSLALNKRYQPSDTESRISFSSDQMITTHICYVPFDTHSLVLSATIVEECAEPEALELICMEGTTDRLVSLLHCSLRFLEAYTGLLLFLALPSAGQLITTSTWWPNFVIHQRAF